MNDVIEIKSKKIVEQIPTVEQNMGQYIITSRFLLLLLLLLLLLYHLFLLLFLRRKMRSWRDSSCFWDFDLRLAFARRLNLSTQLTEFKLILMLMNVRPATNSTGLESI